MRGREREREKEQLARVRRGDGNDANLSARLFVRADQPALPLVLAFAQEATGLSRTIGAAKWRGASRDFSCVARGRAEGLAAESSRVAQKETQ